MLAAAKQGQPAWTEPERVRPAKRLPTDHARDRPKAAAQPAETEQASPEPAQPSRGREQPWRAAAPSHAHSMTRPARVAASQEARTAGSGETGPRSQSPSPPPRTEAASCPRDRHDGVAVAD